MADAAPLWRELQLEIFEDRPYLFLWWMDELVAVRAHIEGVSPSPVSTLHHLERWSLAKESEVNPPSSRRP